GDVIVARTEQCFDVRIDRWLREEPISVYPQSVLQLEIWCAAVRVSQRNGTHQLASIANSRTKLSSERGRSSRLKIRERIECESAENVRGLLLRSSVAAELGRHLETMLVVGAHPRELIQEVLGVRRLRAVEPLASAEGK